MDHDASECMNSIHRVLCIRHTTLCRPHAPIRVIDSLTALRGRTKKTAVHPTFRLIAISTKEDTPSFPLCDMQMAS